MIYRKIWISKTSQNLNSVNLWWGSVRVLPGVVKIAERFEEPKAFS